VTFGNEATIEACLSAVEAACRETTAEIIVVDNNSADRTVEAVSRRPGVRLIREPENRGFGAANNDALRQAGGEFVLFLNPDTQPVLDSFSRAVSYLNAHPETGLVGFRTIREDDRSRAVAGDFPGFRSTLHEFTVFRHTGIFREDYERYRKLDSASLWTQPVDWVSGAAMMLRRETANRVGGFDEQFFLYYEDVDLCRAVRGLGLGVVYLAEAEIAHTGGHSTGQFSRVKAREVLRSAVKYLAKHEGRGRTRLFKLVFIPLVVLEYLIAGARDLLHGFTAWIGRDTERAGRRWRRARKKLTFALCDWLPVALA
jgi:GT2 family glycosyltransferase